MNRIEHALGSLFLVGSVAIAIGFILQTRHGSGAVGCGAVEPGSISESQVFTPYDQQRSHLPDHHLNPDGQPFGGGTFAAVPQSVDGLALSWLIRSDSGTYAYFSRSAVDESTTAASFIVDGGVQYDVEPVDGSGSFAEWLLSRDGARAVKVAIGSAVGAVTWSDPDLYGSRPHNVFWSNGTYNFTLTGETSAEHLITLARQIECG